MQLDTLSAVLRSLGFIALLQAAGMSLFVALFGRGLDRSSTSLRRIIRASALAASAVLVAHYILEAARMADALSGIFDASLQRLLLHSAGATVLAVRLLGLAFIVMASGRRNAAAAPVSVMGAVLIAASFILMGHTLVNPLRPVLAPLLLLHVSVAAFWFGALVPLYTISRRETPATAARVTEDFSRLALWVVPVIFVAGCSMALLLIPDRAVFCRAYGRLLIVKMLGFALLMSIAALNKWRLGPAIASGVPAAGRALRIALGIEYGLIAAVLCVTAVMTAFFSPDN